MTNSVTFPKKKVPLYQSFIAELLKKRKTGPFYAHMTLKNVLMLSGLLSV